MKFERRTQELASTDVYRRRLAQSVLVGLGMVVISLAIGMVGYAWLEGLGWVDAFENAAMILSGMGPLHNPASTPGKLFAGIYALYSGFAVLVIAAVMFAPAVHRVLHKFHLRTEEDEERDEQKPAGKGAPRPKKRR